MACPRLRRQRLYLLDARTVVVANVGPIGCIPYQRETNPSAGTACAEFPNQMARAFNRRLRALVDELGAALPGSRFVYADVYHIVSDIIANYRSHGNRASPCRESIHPRFTTSPCSCRRVRGGGLGVLLRGRAVRRAGAVRADVAVLRRQVQVRVLGPLPPQPSDAANALIARRILDGGPADISPVNVRQLITG